MCADSLSVCQIEAIKVKPLIQLYCRYYGYICNMTFHVFARTLRAVKSNNDYAYKYSTVLPLRDKYFYEMLFFGHKKLTHSCVTWGGPNYSQRDVLTCIAFLSR